MVPQIFISLSGQDVEFASAVERALPRGLARFYPKTFTTGTDLVAEMEQGVEESAIFVLLVSKQSLASHWVRFELDVARVKAIQKKIKILPFIIEPGVDVADFPVWMKGFWISPYVWGPKDIGRIIQEEIFSAHFSNSKLYQRVLGRGALFDKANREIFGIAAEVGTTPNVIILSGTNQVGRRTFAKYYLEQAMPALPFASRGPQINLPQFADLDDIFRGLLEEISPHLSIEGVQKNLNAFRSLGVSAKVSEIVDQLSYFGKRGMATSIYTGSGFFEESGIPKDWIGELVLQLKNREEMVLFLISNRKFRHEYVASYPNLVQVHVPPLDVGDASSLITSTCAIYDMIPFKFSEEINRSIGGHPGVAKAAVRLVANEGLDFIEKRPSNFFSIQDYILAHNIDDKNLSDEQKAILLVLSWVPSLNGSSLERVIRGYLQCSEEDFIDSIEELLLSCLITSNSEGYSIAAELREIFRRRYGFGDDALLQYFSDELSKQWEEESARGRFNANLVDTIIFIFSMAGKALPESFKDLMLPSRLAEIVRFRYNQGRHNRDDLNGVIRWGLASETIKMDETVREEILSIVLQAMIRNRKFEDADALLDKIGKRGYRSVPFLRGFRLRRDGRGEDAIPHYREALKIGKNERYALQELATVLSQLGRTGDLASLLKDYDDNVGESAVLLDFKIGFLISEGDINGAEETISRLANLAQDDGRSVIRTAQILSKRDGRHDKAFELVNEIVLSGIGDQVRARRWRALFAALAREIEIANRDISFLAGLQGQEQTTQRLKVYAALAENDVPLAEKEVEKLDHSSVQNRSLRAQVLERMAGKPGLPLAEKSKLRDEAISLRHQARGADIDV